MCNNMIPLYFITGFLGSGKTSVINNLLNRLSDKKVGLLLNDFGPIGVDETIIESTSHVIETKSLFGGQIFCDCLSGSFVNSIIEIGTNQVDLILVETSGLAKPSSLSKLMSPIVKKSNNRIYFGGMICVVDAERYFPLIQAVNVIEEQLAFSKAVVLNKTDLVSSQHIDSICENIQSIHQAIPTYLTSFGNVELGVLFDNQQSHRQPDVQAQSFAGWGSFGRPETTVFPINVDTSKEQLYKFLSSVYPYFLRIKGVVKLHNRECVNVSIAGSHITINRITDFKNEGTGLVCIYQQSVDGPAILRSKWEQTIQEKHDS